MGRIKPQLLAGSEREVAARLAASMQATEPARLEMPVGRRLVAISPHPDDETLGSPMNYIWDSILARVIADLEDDRR